MFTNYKLSLVIARLPSLCPVTLLQFFCDPYSFLKVIIEHSISTENLKNPKAPLRLLIILRGGGEKPEIGMASVNI